MTAPPEGLVLLLDKPVGPTSFDLVADTRRALRERRVGHTGTLDPLASGLLVVCVGEATKLVPFLTETDKVYAATIQLGRETASGDLDGAVTFEAPPGVAGALEDAAIASAIARLTGTFEQRPPAFSAVKVEGRPLYERARAGETVEAPLRTVRVERFDVLARRGDALDVEVACGKGTYIRSLAIDLGRTLGVGGHLTALRRLRNGAFGVERAGSQVALREGTLPPTARLSPLEAMGGMPRIEASPELALALRQGKTPVVAAAPGRHAVADAQGRLVAIVEVGAEGCARVLRGFGASTLDIP